MSRGIKSDLIRGGKSQLYDLHTDPFEINNLDPLSYNSPNLLKIKDEIRAWAEAEIGLPQLPIVGETKTAYRDICNRAGHILAHKLGKKGKAKGSKCVIKLTLVEKLQKKTL